MFTRLQKIMHPPSIPSIYSILPVLLLVIVFIDLKTLKIPHSVIWITLLSGLIAGIATLGFLSGIQYAFSGLMIEFLFFFILYLIGPMGAGDVKLAAAVGTFLGPHKALFAAVVSVIVGGLMAVTFLIVFFYKREKQPAKRKLPFSPAIACGTLLALWPPNFILPIRTALEL